MANESKQAEFKVVKRSQIHIPENWNARTGQWKKNEDPETGQTWSDFVASIKADGVQTPCDVRANPDKATAKTQPYSLVAGFRRMAGAEEAGVDMIPVMDHGEMSEKDARYRNGQENLARENLRTQDIAWLLYETKKMEPENFSQQALANRFGLSQRYVGKLLGIMTKVQGKILEEWRKERVKVVVNDVLKVADLEQDKQQAAWDHLVNRNKAAAERQASSGTPQEENGKKDIKWMVAAKKRSYDIGFQLGMMSKLECIEVLDDAEWTNAIEILGIIRGVPRDTRVTSRQINSIVSRLNAGIDDGVKKVEEEEAAEAAAEEEAPPLKAVAGGKKK